MRTKRTNSNDGGGEGGGAGEAQRGAVGRSRFRSTVDPKSKLKRRRGPGAPQQGSKATQSQSTKGAANGSSSSGGGGGGGGGSVVGRILGGRSTTSATTTAAGAKRERGGGISRVDIDGGTELGQAPALKKPAFLRGDDRSRANMHLAAARPAPRPRAIVKSEDAPSKPFAASDNVGESPVGGTPTNAANPLFDGDDGLLSAPVTLAAPERSASPEFEPPPPPVPNEKLPAGWVARWSHRKSKYYYMQEATGDSQW